MSYKELVLKTIEYLKPKSGHINIVDSLWKELNLNAEMQSKLRDILLTGELVHLGTDQWTMQLTAKAMLLKPDQLNEDGSIKLEEIIREQKDRIAELKLENLTLENSQLKGKNRREYILLFVGFASSLVLLYLGNTLFGPKSTAPQEIHLKVDMHQDNVDTTFIMKQDSVK